MDSVDELLMLSGIQHFAFCERQWALIHIGQQWDENVFTIEGQHLHDKVNDPYNSATQGETSILRSLNLISSKLGLYGIADVVEIKFKGNKDNSGLLQYRNEDFILTPVEYKRGKPKPDERDEVQLCAQAMCIEEMYSKIIEMGFLYYGETRHRHEVTFTNELRSIVESYSLRMHELFRKGITPPPEYKPHCRSCSLKEICLPKALSNKTSVSIYLKEIFTE